MRKTNEYLNRNTLSAATLLVLAVGLWIMMWIFPYALDDYRFMRFLQIDENGLPDKIDWDNFIYYFVHLKQNDCLRLANMTAVFMLALPKWALGLLCGVIFPLALWLITKTLNLERGIPEIALLTMFFLPWWDGIATIMFNFNYSWSSAVLALALWLFFRDKHLNWFVGGFVGSLLGLWHEGFAAPALAGMGICWIIWKKFRSPGHTLMLMAMCLGVAFLLWVPGMRPKLFEQPNLFNAYDLARIALNLLPVWIFFILSAISWQNCISKKNLPIWLTFVIICIFSAALRSVYDAPRAGWAAVFIGCVGTVWLSSYVFAGLRHSLKRLSAIISFILVALHLTVTDIETFRERNILNQVIEFIRDDSQTGHIIFIKGMKTFNNAPLIAWGKPLQTLWLWNSCENYYHFPLDKRFYHVIPDELRTFKPVRENQLNDSIWLTKEGWIVKKGHNYPPHRIITLVETPIFSERVVTDFQPFISECDGKDYTFIFPVHSSPWIRPIKGIKLSWGEE